jgi:UDP-N-acetylglucosamine diphosphorylase / glucose-1-phosphate thymidylyltransferase / UDP-N-acetylgalactosamine diphosphorylase / glucosamine-1-phosphate N-acetyltransferase / galactosamine-1-phosphate N-acetyltransferase
MKAVLLVAGKSTRCYPLTVTRPKPLLKVANKTIIEHNFEQLALAGVTEAILVIGYKGDMIRKILKNKFTFGDKTVQLTYVEQEKQLGTGHAVLQAKEHLHDEKTFLLMGADDLFFADDLKALLQQENVNAILAQKVSNPASFGILEFDKEDSKKVVSIHEKSEKPPSTFANCGAYTLSTDILNIETKLSLRGESEVTDMINELAKTESFTWVETQQWLPISYAWDILKANKKLLSNLTTKIDGEVEQNVTIKGNVQIGKGTLVKSGTYLEGPVLIGENCVIGPNAFLRGSTTIGNNCKVGHEVELKNCVVNDHSAVPHLSYMGDSVLGENVNIGAGSITANFRHDAGLIRSSIRKDNGKEVGRGVGKEVGVEAGRETGREKETVLVETGLQKLGTIIGDNVKLGIKTLMYPGRKIWPNKITLPGEIVKKDIE